MERISSRDNQLVKLAVQLAAAGAMRERENIFFAEGRRLCFDLAQQQRPAVAFFTERFLKAHPEAEELGSERNCLISEPVDDKLSQTKTPQGLYCLFVLPRYELAHVAAERGVLVCENMQDPTNVGAVLRSAAAFGLGGVVLTTGSADPFSPRALRASMGAALRVPVFCPQTGMEQPDCEVEKVAAVLRKKGMTLYAAALQDAQPLPNVVPKQPFALLIGNEGAGLTPQAIAAADQWVYIPMRGGTESLNAAVAASVLMFHFSNGMD